MAGRPTTYTEEVLKLARDYVDNCPDKVPMVVGLCKHIGRSKATVYSWAKDDDKAAFLDILGEIEENQHIELVNGGLAGEFASPIAKMMMTKHGYSDKQEVDHSSNDGSMTPAPAVQVTKEDIKSIADKL